MTKPLRLALASALAIAALMGPARAAQAGPDGTRDGFGIQASTIARWEQCRNPRTRSNGGAFTASALVCDLRGRRINIIAFDDKPQEKKWLKLACTLLPSQWVMIGYGFVITAKNGNADAAKTGARVYGGDAYRCSDVV